MESIGLRIKSRRKELNKTLADIRDETGISTGNLSDIENGKYLPSSNNLIKLSNTLECSIDWMMKGITPNFTDFSDCLELIELYKQLSPENQRDIIEHIKYKLFKQSKTQQQKSLTSENIKPGSEIA